MSRIPELDPAKLDALQSRIYSELMNGPHGHVVGPHPAWLQSPKLAEKTRALSAFIRFESSLPGPLREIAILICGRYWRADFEYWAHAELARKAGVDSDIIEAIARGQRPHFK
ncbi:MAG: carboxymuconolactone decarboxylase family protein, partial [Deltaproteobacteria bacterium]|nr:carboxymuconolactone decarboxylase family protein [Deltaproteobacteria bacterium]